MFSSSLMVLPSSLLYVVSLYGTTSFLEPLLRRAGFSPHFVVAFWHVSGLFPLPLFRLAFILRINTHTLASLLLSTFGRAYIVRISYRYHQHCIQRSTSWHQQHRRRQSTLPTARHPHLAATTTSTSTTTVTNTTTNHERQQTPCCHG